MPLGPSDLQSNTSTQATSVEVKVPCACSISTDAVTCWGSTEGQLAQGLCLGPQGQRQHAVSKQPTPHTDLQHTLPEEELGTAELSEQ